MCTFRESRILKQFYDMRNVILLVRELSRAVLTIIAMVGPAYMYVQTQNGWMLFMYVLSMLFVMAEHSHYEDVNKQERIFETLREYLRDHPEQVKEILNTLNDEQKAK